MANPPHSPTEETRAEVRALSGFGITQDDIARYLDIDPKTLRKHYREELDTGTTHANAEADAVQRGLIEAYEVCRMIGVEE